MRHVPHMNESCPTYEWVTQRTYESCLTHKWGMFYIWTVVLSHTSCVTHANTSCVTHVNTSHVTRVTLEYTSWTWHDPYSYVWHVSWDNNRIWVTRSNTIVLHRTLSRRILWLASHTMGWLRSVGSIYRSLLQDIVSCIGLFCIRDL